MDVTLLDWLMFVIAIGAFVGASAELLQDETLRAL